MHDPLPHPGDHVVLRRFTPADLAAFQAYRHDPGLGEWQGWQPLDDRDAARFLDEMASAPLFVPGQWVQLAIGHGASQALIGDIGVFLAHDAQQAEVGITLARPFHGQGLAAQALRLALRWLFAHTSVARAVAITDVRNHASIRLLERAGLQRDKTEAAIFKGEPCEEHHYTIARDALARHPELDTPRLRLRPWRDSDRAPFAALNADPEVMAHFPALQTREASDASIEAWQAQFVSHGFGNWAVERRDTGEFIGFTGLSVPRRVLPFSPCVEIGWRLARAHWGQGFASEAARAALAFGFERRRLSEIVSFTALTNTRSRAVMQRIGMEDAGADFDHPGVPEGHVLRRHCLYRLPIARWRTLPRQETP
jgi:RimJ/RimL family protein N-acetyltransferase